MTMPEQGRYSSRRLREQERTPSACLVVAPVDRPDVASTGEGVEGRYWMAVRPDEHGRPGDAFGLPSPGQAVGGSDRDLEDAVRARQVGDGPGPRAGHGAAPEAPAVVEVGQLAAHAAQVRTSAR